MTPHKCPVCDGGGWVPWPIGSTTTAVCPCRACVGTGVVWGPPALFPSPLAVYPPPNGDDIAITLDPNSEWVTT